MEHSELFQAFVEILQNAGKPFSARKKDFVSILEPHGGWEKFHPIFDSNDYAEKPKRGTYDFTNAAVSLINSQTQPIRDDDTVSQPAQAPTIALIPQRKPFYKAWGEHSLIKKIVSSAIFAPTLISGPSGNGKTSMVMDACAVTARPVIRVQISPETDETDLLGGLRLIDGNTIFAEGPVLVAMRQGAILLLDEIDRGTNKIMCLQGVLEGEPVLVKRTGETIAPSPGFQIIATANTKGRGSDSGKYVAASVIDDAFLERFMMHIDMDFATEAVEKNIVEGHMKAAGLDQTLFVGEKKFNFVVKCLVEWARKTRSSVMDDSDPVISTRRLSHIIQTTAITGNMTKAVQLCTDRFDQDDAKAFQSSWKAIFPADLDAHFVEVEKQEKNLASVADSKTTAAAEAARILQARKK